MNANFINGLLGLGFWGSLLAAFVMVQLTFLATTLYLHRDVTHRGLSLRPAVRHVFRFWLWMSTGIVTKEWVAVHRKHHAHCETAEDPHSPVIHGLRKVLLEGAELYRASARDIVVQERFGRGTPDDWMERNVYSRHRHAGIVLMVTTDLLLFGVPGITVVGLQMLAVPLMGAGVINGLGHHTGYRNFECPDAARNIVPWGLLIGGEELHNNHHAFPSSARFSVRPWELDIGWLYIRVLRAFRLADVIRTVPRPARRDPNAPIDLETVRAVVLNRMHVLRAYGQAVIIPTCREQLCGASRKWRRRVAKWLVRESILLDSHARSRLREILASNQTLGTVYAFRERLAVLWRQANTSDECMLQYLRDWIAQAEQSGIGALREFAGVLRSYAICAGHTLDGKAEQAGG